MDSGAIEPVNKWCKYKVRLECINLWTARLFIERGRKGIILLHNLKSYQNDIILSIFSLTFCWPLDGKPNEVFHAWDCEWETFSL